MRRSSSALLALSFAAALNACTEGTTPDCSANACGGPSDGSFLSDAPSDATTDAPADAAPGVNVDAAPIVDASDAG